MKLDRYLIFYGITTRKFARLMRRSPWTVAKWRQGKRTPLFHDMIKIGKVTKGEVTFEDWDSKKRRK